MSDRKLAHIERVVKVEPIEGADKIEKVTVLGWEVVCRKGEVKEGDLVCYIEIDSIVPDISYFEFMKERKFRVKTIKLRGQVSQGLIIPLKDVMKIGSELSVNSNYNKKIVYMKEEEGNDCTKYLSIIKWLSPTEREEEQDYQKQCKKYNWFIRYFTRFSWFRKLFKKKSKSFPSWIRKTDEERLQNIPWILKDQKNDWYATEKLDGQSATYWIKKKWFGYEFGICSRSVRKFEHDNSNWSRAAKQLDIKNKLIAMQKLIGDCAIQGELIGRSEKGSNIQGNKYKLDKFDFYVFNLFSIEKNKYFEYPENLLLSQLFKFVPVLGENLQLDSAVESMVINSKGKSLIADTLREGVVWRKMDQSQSFKVINPDFLLKNEE